MTPRSIGGSPLLAGTPPLAARNPRDATANATAAGEVAAGQTTDTPPPDGDNGSVDARRDTPRDRF